MLWSYGVFHSFCVFRGGGNLGWELKDLGAWACVDAVLPFMPSVMELLLCPIANTCCVTSMGFSFWNVMVLYRPTGPPIFCIKM